MSRKRERICPRCMEGNILVGESAKYNPRAKDGTIVCPRCKVEESIIELMLKDVNG